MTMVMPWHPASAFVAAHNLRMANVFFVVFRAGLLSFPSILSAPRDEFDYSALAACTAGRQPERLFLHLLRAARSIHIAQKVFRLAPQSPLALPDSQYSESRQRGFCASRVCDSLGVKQFRDQQSIAPTLIADRCRVRSSVQMPAKVPKTTKRLQVVLLQVQ